MNDNKRLQRMIREANVQRSAAVGAFLGEFLGDLWLGMFGKASERTPSVNKAVQAR